MTDARAATGARGSFWHSLATVALLALILAVAAYFSFLGIDWDQGHHLHPDERFLTMVASSLSLPQSLGQYLDSQSSTLNPRNTGHTYFVYGSWPITIVYLVARALNQTGYHQVHLVGRKLMAISNLLGIVLLYVLGVRLYDRRVALLAAAFAAVTAFLVQQSHFYTVDMAVNFFVLLFFVAAVGMVQYGRWDDIVFAGLALGMALASKISIWPLVPIAVIALILAERHRRPGLRRTMPRLSAELLLLGLMAFLTLRVTQPDMWAGPQWRGDVTVAAPSWWFQIERRLPEALKPLLLPDPRWAQNMDQVRSLMSDHGIDFPPNHQWWGRRDWWFPWQNMVLWGMGVPLGLTVWLGWLAAGVALLRGQLRHLLPWLTVALLFGYLGMQWSKTMRYFLPLYPLLILLGAWGLVRMFDWSRFQSQAASGKRFTRYLPHLAAGLAALILVTTAVWAFMFSRIYTRDHSRVQASRWIYHNLPSAVALHIKAGPADWRLLPANHSSSFTFTGHRYSVERDGRLESQRVLVSAKEPVTVDGVVWSHLTKVTEDEKPVRFAARLTTRPFPGEGGRLEGVIASGQTSARLSASGEQTVTIPLPPTELTAGGEYYLWLEVLGAPINGRLSVILSETPWDDVLPLGLDGYAAHDNPDTPWGEGVFAEYLIAEPGGSGRMPDMYDEDEPAKVDRLLDALAASDYMVLSSNRVYGAIRQLPTRYPMSIHFYDLLFAERAGYEHVASIHSFPNLGRWEIDDQPADEAWHVYDHPRVDVFARRADFDKAGLRAQLMPLTDPGVRTWRGFQAEAQADRGPIGRWLARLAARRQSGEVVGSSAQRKVDLLLSPERVAAQRAGGTWRLIFSPHSLLNRSPVMAILVWYAALWLVGLAAFPWLSLALRPLADRGWSVSRPAGMLITSWLAWLLSSTGRLAHTRMLVAVCLAGLVCSSIILVWRQRGPLGKWVAAHWRLLAVEELLFAGLFVLFLAIRMGNPDLWHPWYGGEKPMDFAYLNAVLRTVSFPPYDPWFAGGQMNYYYYGFVFVAVLVKLTTIVPWVAYNLIIPSLAAMTGLGVFGIVHSWCRGSHVPPRLAVAAGLVGAVLGVVSGNLYQVQLIAHRLADLAPGQLPSRLPVLATLIRAAQGWWQVVAHGARLNIGRGNWYWDASRAITVPSDTPITEFPFFTFLYADLHAHMMALPITTLALAAALAWVLPMRRRAWPAILPEGWQLARLGLAALAVGALWPTNTWDYPTYMAVVGGAIVAAAWPRQGRLGWVWLGRPLLQLVPLVLASLLFFWPYHATYARPYGSFQLWWGSRTPLASYVTIHGIFLFAILSLAILRLVALVRAEPTAVWRRMAGAAVVFGVPLIALAWRAQRDISLDAGRPTPWVPLFGLLSLVAAGVWLTWPRRQSHERLLAWLLLLGVGLTLAVEYLVLSGDIGRMNTVFKFYIQVWILWSVLAGVAVALIGLRLRRVAWARWWWTVLAVLIGCGLLYPVTAAPAKIRDRFPPMAGADLDYQDYAANWQPGLSGIAYTDYAVYDDDGYPLRLAHDRDAILWFLEHVAGTPTILEGFREKGYRWGARYSIHTGLPTVIGWDWHQKQQRNAVGGHVVDERTRDVAEIYNTADDVRARQLLADHGVEYVIVGQMERAFYSAEGLAKFDRWLDQGSAALAYQNAGVRVLRLVNEGAGS